MMNKPTLFFSHSSKDKKNMNILKDLIQDKTSGTLNIFLSSDGESIPFGSNWVHSIEKGLNDAQLMFVFITPNSIKSDWIFFESGFGYAKNVKVIPIGLNVDISTLNPPLNLLQGFNLSSSEGLNNIIKVINDYCNTQFKEDFTDTDFIKLESIQSDSSLLQNRFVSHFQTVFSTYLTADNTKLTPNNAKALEIIKNRINENGTYIKIGNSSKNSTPRVKEGIFAAGLSISWDNMKFESNMTIKIDPNAFTQHFDKIVEGFNSAYESKSKHYFQVFIDDNYILNVNELQTSTILANDIRFKLCNDKQYISPFYQYNKIIFAIIPNKDTPCIHMLFDTTDSTASSDILKVLDILYELGIIK